MATATNLTTNLSNANSNMTNTNATNMTIASASEPRKVAAARSPRLYGVTTRKSPTTAAPPRLLFDRFELKEKLGEGSFGKIYRGIDLTSQRLVAIKIETSKQSSHSQLKNEDMVYKDMEGALVGKRGVRWPKSRGFGKDPVTKNNVLVMDLLGPNLDSLLKKTPSGHFSPTAVAYLAEKMLDLVETLHMNGYIHRDLKPQNFVIEYADGANLPRFPEVFLIDYGLVKSFVTPDKKFHVPPQMRRTMKGTVRYSSVSTHLGMDQSRRDDLQSLGYMLLFMLLGRLPWQNLMKDREKTEAYHHIMIIKMGTPLERLLENVDSTIRTPLTLYFCYVNSLMYDREPNYQYCRDLFHGVSSGFHGNLLR